MQNNNDLRKSPAQTGQVIGVDVGGTFTDLVLLNQCSGEVRLAKVPSTPENQAFGVLAAVKEAEADLSKTDLIVHGTTTTTNAVLERKLCKTGLITTRGFRDVLELGRRERPSPYGMRGRFKPIIPRDLRTEVPERIDAEGRVLVPLDESFLEDCSRYLLGKGCEAVVVHFLHSYSNPVHELRAGEILSEIWPNKYVTLGHSLLTESREFERGVTAAVNASVQPLLEQYINRLSGELRQRGYRSELLVMNGNGGMVSSQKVAVEAAKTVMSGPASGVMAAAYTGRLLGMPNLITYDMGGTSTDVALINSAEPSVSNEIELEYAMPIHVPMVDVRTVGAGGGSIAKVNSAGLLEIGPESAGAAPGPILYGKGGAQPTIADANLLLGRLDASRIKSIRSSLTRNKVEEIFECNLGRKLGLNAFQAAAAVVKVANAKMAGAIRLVSISLGADPRDYALFAFGGAGPLHASALAKELGVPRVLVPSRPGTTNALGCLVADLRYDYVRTINRSVDRIDVRELHEVFAQQTREGESLARGEKLPISRIKRGYSVDMQFVGQTHLLRVELPDSKPSRESLQKMFEQAYFERFRVELPEIRANLVNANSSIVGMRHEIDLAHLFDASLKREKLSDAMIESRNVYFGGNWEHTSVYWRDYLPPVCTINGPAVVAQMDSTVLVEPGDAAQCDPSGNIVIEIGGAS